MDPIGFEAASERRPGTVERAFQIARVGGCDGMSDLVRILKGERFEKVDEHLAGPSIRRELRQAWEAGALAGPIGQEPTGEPGR
jgi:hypothetical protein